MTPPVQDRRAQEVGGISVTNTHLSFGQEFGQGIEKSLIMPDGSASSDKRKNSSTVKGDYGLSNLRSLTLVSEVLSELQSIASCQKLVSWDRITRLIG